MDACQKHLMLPWMKAVGGRGKDRGRDRAVLSRAELCSWGFWSEAVAIFQYGKSGRAERLRRGEILTNSPTRNLTQSILSESHILSQKHTLSPEWGSGPEP